MTPFDFLFLASRLFMISFSLPFYEVFCIHDTFYSVFLPKRCHVHMTPFGASACCYFYLTEFSYFSSRGFGKYFWFSLF